MILLKQSTQTTIRIGPFVDKTDGVTEETGLAGNGTEISKNGGAFGTGPTLGTHDAEGYYPVTLTTSHLDTVGPFTIKSHDSATHVPVWHECMVLPANVYDSLVAGTDALDVSLIQWLGTAPLALSSQKVQAEDSATYARIGAPSGASIAADIATKPSAASVADAVWDELLSGHAITGSAGAALSASSPAGARTITITVTESAVGIPDVNVDLYDETNTVFLGRVTCDSAGEATLNVDDGSYTIRLSRHNFEPTNASEAITVSADASVGYTGTVLTQAPVDPTFAAQTRRQRMRYDSTNADNPLRVQVVRDGAKLTPGSATITIYAPGNSTALVTAQAMDVSNDVLLYEVDTTTESDWPITTGYRAEITAIISGASYQETVVFDVARFVLNIPISVDELIARDDSMRNLEHDGGVSFATLIEACRDEIQLELETKAVKDGQLLENMVLDSSRLAVLFRPYVLAAVWNEKRDYDHAERYRKSFEDMLATYLAGVSYDTDQDGEEDTSPGEYKPTRMKL